MSSRIKPECRATGGAESRLWYLCGMQDEAQVRAAESGFFSALVAGNTETLEHLLAADFTLVGINGALIGKSELIGAMAAGVLIFNRVEPVEAAVRFYGATAVVTGQTRMNGAFGGVPFAAESRYTHVFVGQDGRWQLVAAQGTPIAGEPGSAT